MERGFDFLLTPHLDRRVRRLGVRHRNYVGRLMQRGGGAPLAAEERQILPRQMEEALQRAIREQVLNDPEVGPNDHFLININSNRLRHSYHSSRMRVRDWLDNTLRAQEIMQQISRMLNSNDSTDTPQDFDPDAFLETLSELKPEEPPYRNPSPPGTPILHVCPLHPQEVLDKRETDTQ